MNHPTDKQENLYLLRNYESLFANIVSKEIKLLELGIFKGGSLLMWRDYFEKGIIVGLDIEPVHIDDSTGRIRVYQGRQEDTCLLSRIAEEQAPDGFDIIIDDCSHIGELTRTSFWHLFQHHLKAGGIYAIEDWGTGYWSWYVDGRAYQVPEQRASTKLAACLIQSVKSLCNNGMVMRIPRLSSLLRRYAYATKLTSHDYGMVGFVKQLVDECGMGDITHPKYGKGPYRPSQIASMQISHGLVIVVKA